MTVYTKRFKRGEFRYSTRAYVLGDDVIIAQSERADHPKIDARSLVVMSKSDFLQMVRTLKEALCQK